MTALDLALLYMGWAGVWLTSVALGYFGILDILGRKRK